LEIVWKNEEEFQRLVLRMGSFHLCCTFLAVLGKRFGDAGLKDILVESEVVACGSMNALLDGKHYNRAIRAHKLIMEAMLRLKWEYFLTWLQKHDDLTPVAKVLQPINEAQSKFNT
jgi:hypothetical protein